MTINDLLAEFGRKAGLGALALTAEGVCRLTFDGALTVDLEHDTATDTLHVYGVAGSLPAEGREAILSDCLAANLFGGETGGAALALDRERGEIVLCRSLPAAPLDTPTFEAMLGAFVNALEHHRDRLAQAPATPDRPAADMLPLGGMLRA